MGIFILCLTSILALKAHTPHTVSELMIVLNDDSEQFGSAVIPESVKKYFLPFDRLHLCDRFTMMPDANIVEFAHTGLQPVVVPNERHYWYKHIGILDAFASRPERWTKTPIYGRIWPLYGHVLPGHRDRILGWLFVPRTGSESRPCSQGY